MGVVSPEQLVHVEFNECNRYCLLLFAVLPGHLVDSLRDVLQHEVQVDLVLLLSAGVEEIQEAHDVAVIQPSHYLEFAVLKPERRKSYVSVPSPLTIRREMTHLLSCKTFLIATISPVSQSLAW